MVEETQQSKRKKIAKEIRLLLSEYDLRDILTAMTLKVVFGTQKGVEEKVSMFPLIPRIEYLAGLIASIKFNPDNKGRPDDDTEKRINELVDKIALSYWEDELVAVRGREISPSEKELEEMEQSFTAKNHALFLRGDALKEQLEKSAKLNFRPIKDHMIAKFGFDIDDAIQFSEVIGKKLEDKINEQAEKIRQEMGFLKKEHEEFQKMAECGANIETLTKKLDSIKNDPQTQEKFQNMETLIENEKFALSLSLDEIKSLFPPEKQDGVEGFMHRMSSECGTVNHNFDEPLNLQVNTFNHLNKTPFLRIEDRYYLPVPQLLNWNIHKTFHYDFIADNKTEYSFTDRERRTENYTYDRLRGKIIEEAVCAALEKVVPPEIIFTNQKYDLNGIEGEADVAVVYDNNIILFECKGKRITAKSFEGNYESIKTDLNKSIVAAYKQGKRTKNLILESKLKEFKNKYQTIKFDSTKIRSIMVVCVTDSLYTRFSTNPQFLKDLITDFDGDFPFVVNIFDLEIIMSKMDHTAQLLHYLKKRISLTEDGRVGSPDELDFLGHYLVRKLIFGEDSDSADRIEFAGMEEEVFKEEPIDYKTDIIDCLIEDAKQNDSVENNSIILETLYDFTQDERKKMDVCAKKIHAKALNDDLPHDTTFIYDWRSLGVTIMFQKTNNLSDLITRLNGYCSMKKYQTKMRKWLGAAIALGMQTQIIYMEYEWTYNEDAEKWIKEYLRPHK